MKTGGPLAVLSLSSPGVDKEAGSQGGGQGVAVTGSGDPGYTRAEAGGQGERLGELEAGQPRAGRSW